MKTLFKYIYSLAVLLLIVTSCENPLDQQAVDTFNQDVVFSDVYVAKAFLGKCYDRMGGNTDAGVLGQREDLLSSATDQTLCIHRPANYVNLKGTQSPDQLGYFANNGYGGFLRWPNLYSDIQNVNVVLANIDAVPTTTSAEEALKTQLKGEAYFIRALLYTNLLMGHGGQVLSSEPWALGQDFLTVIRSTIAETKDFILADIALAISTLPATMEQGRANRAAAAALKARLLMFCASKLTNGGYEPTNTLVSFPSGSQTALLQAARDAAKAVMDGTYGTFSLVGTTADPPSPMTDATVKTYADNFFSIFNQKGKWNSETIWGIQFPLTGGNVNNANLWYGPNGYHNWGNNDPTEPAVRSFEMNDGTKFVWDKYNPGEQNLRTATAAELAADPQRSPYAGREPRFYATVFYHGAPWQARPVDAVKYDPLNQVQTGNFYNDDGTVKQYGVDTRNSAIENWNATKTGYYIKKFLDPATVGQYFRNTNTWVEFRYAEILLIYAEACIELANLGQTADLQNGIDNLNLVRNRAGLPDRVTADPLQARDWLRYEREIEFFGEGHRWFDIRRWMICDQVIKNVYGMKIKQFTNGNMEWKLDLTDLEDTRSWGGDKIYWLPIPRDEMNKAGTEFKQNPGYSK
jgi:starch-binding outer membrane protein, SusD/RagB family